MPKKKPKPTAAPPRGSFVENPLISISSETPGSSDYLDVILGDDYVSFSSNIKRSDGSRESVSVMIAATDFEKLVDRARTHRFSHHSPRS